MTRTRLTNFAKFRGAVAIFPIATVAPFGERTACARETIPDPRIKMIAEAISKVTDGVRHIAPVATGTGGKRLRTKIDVVVRDVIAAQRNARLTAQNAVNNASEVNRLASACSI